MAWAIKDISGKGNKRFCRAILSKYGTRVSAAIYLVKSRAILESLLGEIDWCNKKGLILKIEVIGAGDLDLMFIG